MTKREFLAVLQRELYTLPQKELREQLNFYSEMIDDRMDDGLSEEEAVSKIGSISEILSQIDNQKGITGVAPSEKSEAKLGALGKTLLIIGSPLWIALVVAGFAVLAALYASVWAIWASLCAVEVTLWAGALVGVVAFLLYVPQGVLIPAAFLFGGGLVCFGLSVFLWYGCKWLLVLVVKLTVWSFSTVISLFKFRRY